MKTKIIESLKIRTLLVDELPIDVISAKIFGNELMVLFEGDDSFSPFSNIDGDWTLLGKLKDLTDSDCEGLVEFITKGKSLYNPYNIYQDYTVLTTKLFLKLSAKESFLSALESEGVKFHNHLKTYVENYKDCDEFYEADKNVFSENTLVFVEL